MKKNIEKFYQLDTTRVCNLRCIFCYKAEEKDSSCNEISDFMSLSQVKKIINKDTKASGVSLVNNGEFFLNPQWKEIMEHIFSVQSEYSNLGVISLNTNASLLNKENTDHIINNVKRFCIHFNLVFSVNAAKEETYRKITGKDLLKKTEENIREFIQKVAEEKTLRHLLTVSIQAVVSPQNHFEIAEFVKKWDRFYRSVGVDHEIIEDNYCSQKPFLIALRRILMKGVDGNRLFSDAIKELDKEFEVRTNEDQLERSIDYFRRKACKYLFEYPAIKDNQVSICCRDTFMRHVYKKRGEQENAKERFFKLSHILGEFENIALCRACENYESMKIEDVKAYLDEVDLSDHPIDEFRLLTLGVDELNSDELFEYYSHRLKNGFSYFLYNKDAPQKLLSRETDINELDKVKEMDFCVAWSRYIFEENGLIKAGCDRQIRVEDLETYIEMIRKHDLSCLPDECIFCEKKFSHEPLRDRSYTYPTGNREAFIVNNSNILRHREYVDLLDEKSFEKALLLLESFKSNQLIREFMEFKYDSKKLCEIVLDTKDVFLICEYALFTDDNELSARAFKYILSMNVSRIPFPKLIIKMLEKNIDLIINNSVQLYRTLKYMQQRTDYKSVIENTLIVLYRKDLKNIEKLKSVFDERIFIKTLKYFLIEALEKNAIDLEKYFELVEKHLKDKVKDSDFITPTAIGFLRAKRYFSLYSFMIKYKERIKDPLFNDISQIDFNDYDNRYIHLLVALCAGFKEKRDQLLYQIYSWYMKKESYVKAKHYFDIIEKKEDFWDDDSLEKTRAFLENPQTSIRSRFFGIFKGR